MPRTVNGASGAGGPHADEQHTAYPTTGQVASTVAAATAPLATTAALAAESTARAAAISPLATTVELAAESTARQAADATAATNLSAAVVAEAADRNSAISAATAPLATTAALAAESTARAAAIAPLAASTELAAESTARQAAIATEVADRNSAISTATSDLFATAAGGNTLASGQAGMLVSVNSLGKAESSGQLVGTVQSAVQKAAGAALASQTLPYSGNGTLTTAATATPIAVAGPLDMQSNALSFDKTTGACVNSADADTAWEFGRGVVGFDGLHGDEFAFAHRANMSANDHALGQQADGATNVNCKAGTSVAISMDGTPIAEFRNTEVVFASKLEVPTSGVPNGPILTDGTVNNTHSIEAGGGKMEGWVGSSSYANFCHRSVASTISNYAFMSSASAQTSIHNATISALVTINNASRLSVTNGAFTGTYAYQVVSDARFKTNVSVPDPTKLWTDFKAIGLKQYFKVYPNVNTDRIRLGVIAQELEASHSPFCRNAVGELTMHKMQTTDPVELEIYDQGDVYTDDDGDEHSAGFKVVEYDQLYRMNIAVTQALQERVEAMEAQLAAMVAAQQ